MKDDLKRIAAYFSVLIGVLISLGGWIFFIFGIFAISMGSSAVIILSIGALIPAVGGYFLAKYAMKFLRDLNSK